METIAKEATSEIKIIPQHIAVTYRAEALDRATYQQAKRIFDVIVSIILIAGVLSWLYPVLFIIIRLSSRGGELFVQRRVGLKGKVFNCYKFRTMVVNKEADRLAAVHNDKRITVIGRWLRRTYIDELPQLVNVLMGDMSIVGPRPHMLYHHQQFCREIGCYNDRHDVKPGITGLSQMKGYHGAVFDHYRIYGRTRLDLFYIKKASFAFDMQILAGTILLMFSKKEKKS